MKSRLLILALFVITGVSVAELPPHPLFRDFVGLNGHSCVFKPELYKPVCGVVRDYHPVDWDLKGDTGKPPDWPEARNRVSWEKEYGSWNKAGLRIDACLQFDNMKADWKNLGPDAYAYAKSFAQNFGPGGRWPYVEWIEIGNEPGLYDDAMYRTLFESMARGIREGCPKMKIATCNVEAGPSDRYWKGVELFKDHPELYDVLHIHRYAIAEQWPVWRRTYPENPAVPYLSSIQKLLDWRNANAPGKEVWVTEFGWDASTKKPDPKGEWAKWLGNSDEEQARWLVRSFFLFAAMGVEKAFVYDFNDEDKPQLHACSGLTRHYQPKPAYHAVAWMLHSLADYRFSRALKQSLEDGYEYEFVSDKADAPVIRAVWHATKPKHVMKISLGGRKLLRAELMPLAKDDVHDPVIESYGDADEFKMAAGERPCLLWLAPKG